MGSSIVGRVSHDRKSIATVNNDNLRKQINVARNTICSITTVNNDNLQKHNGDTTYIPNSITTVNNDNLRKPI